MQLPYPNISSEADSQYGAVDPNRLALSHIKANFAALAAAFGTPNAGNAVTDLIPGSGPVTGYAPSGFDQTTGRLDILAAADGTVINDLPVGADGQQVVIRNTSTTDNLTLTNQNAGSAAAKRFLGSGDLQIGPGGRSTLIYYAGSVNSWSMA